MLLFFSSDFIARDMPETRWEAGSGPKNRRGSAGYIGGDTLFWEHSGRAPAPPALAQHAFDQSAIGIWRVAVTPFGVPVMAFFIIALRMSQAKVQQIAGAAQAAWPDMLNGGPETGPGVEAQASAADQAFACPEAISEAEGGVGGSNQIFLTYRHGPLCFLRCFITWVASLPAAVFTVLCQVRLIKIIGAKSLVQR